MDKELKLATSMDQFYHDDKLNDQYVVQRPSARASRRKDEFIWYDKTSDTFVKPNPWLWVNPNIACPIQYGADTKDQQTVCEPAEEVQTSVQHPLGTHRQLTSENHKFTSHDAPLQEKQLHSVSCSTEYTDGKTVRCMKSGRWSRPPVNYCILIALALKSSHAGSLKVQQIYNFIREHFPFFQTAPDGWKNTIRHNLCFNNSFRKTCNQLCRDGKRKSCFWHLTLDGHRRLRDEIQTLTGESFKQLEMSMSHPGGVGCLLLDRSQQETQDNSSDRLRMMMKSHLKGPLLLFLLLLFLFSSTVSGLGSVVHRDYLYWHEYNTWVEAQSICRSYYTDLALYYKQSDRDNTYFHHYKAWIGLYKEEEEDDDDWTWTNGKELKSIKYGPNETSSTDTCAYYCYGENRMRAGSCDEQYFFICHYKKKGSRLHYIFVSQAMSWSDARQYCQDKHVDLAAFSDVSKLSSEIHAEDFPAWIGLHGDGDSWKWSTGVSEYTHWAPYQPGNRSDCVTISSLTKNMATRSCSSRFPFICFTDNLVLVKENKTWEEALEHCRTMRSPNHYQHYFRYEMASVQPGEDQEIVIATILGSDTEEVWAGLRFMGGHWWWVNGADMLYSNLPVCPLNWEHCGALSKNDTVNMLNRDCLEKKNFLCYRL